MNQNKKSDEKKDDIEEIIKRLGINMKSSRSGIRYSNDEQIKNKRKLMESYFQLIDFELINKISLEEYKNIINNPIVASPEVSKELENQYKEFEKITSVIDNSYFKDIINEKLDKSFEAKKGKQKIKK